MSVNVLPYAPEKVADIFYNWCMAAQTPGMVMHNDMLHLRAEPRGVTLLYNSRKSGFWTICDYFYDSDGGRGRWRGPELALWFSSIPLLHLSKIVWQAILEKFCPDLSLVLADSKTQLFAVCYPDGRTDSGSVLASGQRICVYPASERTRRHPTLETTPLTFADMEGVL